MAMNDNREEKAQLDRREFDLDMEEQEKQRRERDAMVVKVRQAFILLSNKKISHLKMREETVTQNLVRLMKREVIKQQCWDSMAVKGRCIEVYFIISH
jgi:hypothetical protein